MAPCPPRRTNSFACAISLFQKQFTMKMLMYFSRPTGVPRSRFSTKDWTFCHGSPKHDIHILSTLRPRQNGRKFPDIFKCIFFNIYEISIRVSLKFVPKGQINNITTLVQVMAWRRPGDKPLSETMMVSLLTHICDTQRWFKFQCICIYISAALYIIYKK